jgi:hypothetical protein
MSTSLYFKPVLPEKYKALNDTLKYILKEKFDLNQGTVRLTRNHLEYLNGLNDAKVPGADILIKNINQYDAVDIWIG